MKRSSRVGRALGNLVPALFQQSGYTISCAPSTALAACGYPPRGHDGLESRISRRVRQAPISDIASLALRLLPGKSLSHHEKVCNDWQGGEALFKVFAAMSAFGTVSG